MNNLVTLMLILAGLTLLLLRNGTKRQRRANRKLAIILLLVGVASGGYTYTQQHPQTNWLPTLTSSNSSSTSTAKTGTSQQPVKQLAQLTENGQPEITINNNDPGFTQSELTTSNGPWTRFSDLDSLNRVGTANALLNQSIMPKVKREPLTWNPTGWHNKKVHGEWLYNRSHLIGFQLSGENNNPKNLMTGTRQLNSPLMQAHEDDIAHYLKQSPQHFVRYEVTPVFRGDERLARGVAMRAQSIGDNTIRFNVYIFNVQPGVTLNYSDGTSQIN